MQAAFYSGHSVRDIEQLIRDLETGALEDARVYDNGESDRNSAEIAALLTVDNAMRQPAWARVNEPIGQILAASLQEV